MKSSTGIFLGLWSKYRSCNFTEQIKSLEWLRPVNYLINKCDQKIRQVKNQKITHQIPEEKLTQLGLRQCCLVLANGCNVLHLVSSMSRTYYISNLRFLVVKL